jgi:competence protein ComFC
MGIWIIKCIKYIIHCVLAVIYDSSYVCISCGNSDEDALVCSNCFEKFVGFEIKYNIERESLKLVAYSAAYYSGIIKELVLRLKYKSDFEAGKVLSMLLIEIIKREDISFDYITFVPSSKNALKKRGYNQSEYLARQIGESMNKKVVKVLEKSRITKDQIGLDGTNRWENLQDSFEIINGSLKEKGCILLVDDVITTGATVYYCSKQLIKYGCLDVIVLTVAKSSI